MSIGATYNTAHIVPDGYVLQFLAQMMDWSPPLP
jgi:hypothetical protein